MIHFRMKILQMYCIPQPSTWKSIVLCYRPFAFRGRPYFPTCVYIVVYTRFKEKTSRFRSMFAKFWFIDNLELFLLYVQCTYTIFTYPGFELVLHEKVLTLKPRACPLSFHLYKEELHQLQISEFDITLRSGKSTI